MTSRIRRGRRRLARVRFSLSLQRYEPNVKGKGDGGWLT